MAEHILRVLHLSDLHEGQEDRSGGARWRVRRVLGAAWEENLQVLRRDCDARGWPVDLVCFTGDAAFSGKPEEYARATEFLRLTRERLGVPAERLFVAAGNHDVDRELKKASWKRLRDGLTIEDRVALARWLGGGRPPRGFTKRQLQDVMERQAAYREWVRTDLGRPGLAPDPPRLGYRETLRLDRLPFPVHVVGLNTAWLCGDNYDSGQLWLTDEQVMSCLTEDGEPLAGLRLALMHHPFGWLTDESDARRLVAERADLVLRGHLHETDVNLWLDPDRGVQTAAVGCLYEHDRYPNSMQVIDLYLEDTGRLRRCKYWFRGWSGRGFWYDDDSLYKGSWGGRLVFPPPPPEPGPEPAPTPVFVGREGELARVKQSLLEPHAGGTQPVAICAVEGMPGVGKSHLATRFYQVHAGEFPGRLHLIVLAPEESRPASALLAELADRLQVRAADPDALRERLRQPQSLVVVENIDSETLAETAAEVARALLGCPLLLVGRYRGLGDGSSWGRVEVRPWNPAEGLEQLREELGPEHTGRYSEARLRSLVEAVGGLPLALHLAAGHLRRRATPEWFLQQLKETGLSLGPANPGDPVMQGERARAILASSFEISAAALRESLGDQEERLWPSFCALGHAPLPGFGDSLGAAAAGLELLEFETLRIQAYGLGLLEAVEDRKDGAHRLHPLLAEWLRGRPEAPGGSEVFERISAWFLERLPRPRGAAAAGEWSAWKEIQAEEVALAEWLATVPDSMLRSVERAGTHFAIQSGPWSAWAALCERGLVVDARAEAASGFLWTLGQVRFESGDLAGARSAAADKERVDRERGDERETAMAAGLRADILTIQGEWDEALRIWREETLPVFQRLDDVRELAATQGRIADILSNRGEVDEPLRIYREEILPVYERLDDAYSVAWTQRRIADFLSDRGELDEALRIYRDEVLPVLRRSGDVRELAATQGRIADVFLQAGIFKLGELDLPAGRVGRGVAHSGGGRAARL